MSFSQGIVQLQRPRCGGSHQRNHLVRGSGGGSGDPRVTIRKTTVRGREIRIGGNCLLEITDTHFGVLSAAAIEIVDASQEIFVSGGRWRGPGLKICRAGHLTAKRFHDRPRNPPLHRDRIV